MDNSPVPIANHNYEILSNKEKITSKEGSQPQESEVASLNRRTINYLQTILRGNPEADLQRFFPRSYVDRLRAAGGPRTAAQADNPEPNDADDFRHRLSISKEGTVVFPLSDEVNSLLAKYAGGGCSFIASLKQLIWDSPKLWESPIRGIVVKCSDHVVAKVLYGTGDHTEYSALQYLADHLQIYRPRGHTG